MRDSAGISPGFAPVNVGILRANRVEALRSLGDDIASAAPKDVLAGAPVNLYAVVETTRRGQRRFYGPVDRIRLGGDGAEVVDVEPWSTWWNALEVLWFKVEPIYGFYNEGFDPDFSFAKTIARTDDELGSGLPEWLLIDDSNVFGATCSPYDHCLNRLFRKYRRHSKDKSRTHGNCKSKC